MDHPAFSHPSGSAEPDLDPAVFDNDRDLAFASGMLEHFLQTRLIVADVDVFGLCSICRPGIGRVGSTRLAVNNHFRHRRTSEQVFFTIIKSRETEIKK
jgi:hypothetical protein